MTCFWDGILKKTTSKNFMVDGQENDFPRTAKQLAEFFKNNNTRTIHVRWNGEKPLRRQLLENYHAVKEYRVRSAKLGYYCSTFDPFLFLASELFQVNIIHEYMNNKIRYEYIDEKNQNQYPTWRFCSNGHHFWAGRDRRRRK